MATYNVIAPDGKKFALEGDHAPSESELNDIYAKLSPPTRTNKIEPTAVDAPFMVGAAKPGQDFLTKSLKAKNEGIISPEDVPTGAEMTEATGIPKVLTVPISAVDKMAAGLAQFLTSPSGVTQTTAALSPAAPVVYAKWAYDMLKSGVDSLDDIKNAIGQKIVEQFNNQMVVKNNLGKPATDEEKSDLSQRLAEDAVNAAVMVAGGLGAGAHAVKSAAEIVKPAPKPVEPKLPLAPATEAAVKETLATKPEEVKENASEISKATEIHGDVRPLGKPAEQLSVTQSSGGVQPQPEGATLAQGAQETPKLKPSDLQPALLVNGEAVTGGETHAEIAQGVIKSGDGKKMEGALNAMLPENDNLHIFVDKNGKQYSRTEAAKALGVEDEMAAKGGLHSQDLKELQDKQIKTENLMVSVQGAIGDAPASVQFVDTSNQDETSGKITADDLKKAGHDVPDFSKLPQGRYTWDEAVKKLKEQPSPEIAKAAPAATAVPTETTLGERQPEKAGGSGGESEKVKTEFESISPEHKAFSEGLQKAVDVKSISSDGANLIREVFKDADPKLLAKSVISINNKRKFAGFAFHRGGIELKKNVMDVLEQRNSNFGEERSVSLVTHEIGHQGYNHILSDSDRKIVTSVFRKMPLKDRVEFFRKGVTANTPEAKNKYSSEYHAGNEREFFAQSFAEYLLKNKLPDPEIKPLFEKIVSKIKAAFSSLFERGERLKELEPLYDKIIKKEPNEPIEPIGMGGAVKGEFEGGNAGADIYGIAQRVREKRAKAGQVGEVPIGEGTSAEELVQHGREMLAEGADPEAVMKNFEKTKRLSSDDVAVVRAHGEEIAKAARNIEEKFGTESPEYLTAFKALTDWDARVKKMQTESSEAFRAQQGETDLVDGSFTGLAAAHHEIYGEDMKPDEKKEAKKVAEKIKQADTKTKEAADKLQLNLDNLDEKGVPKYSPYILQIVEKIVGKLDQRAEASRQALKAIWGRTSAGVDPTIIGHLANIGASHIAHWGLDFAKWSDAMVRDLGERVRPHLEEVFEASKKLVDDEAATHGKDADAVKDVIKKSKKPKVPETLEEQRKVFQDYKAGGTMTPEQVKTLWHRAKTEYIDKGVISQAEIVNKLATELGLSVKDVAKGLAQNKEVKRAADEVWKQQRQTAHLKDAAKRWLANQRTPWLGKVPVQFANLMFKLRVGGHGFVAPGTHAPLLAYMPQYWPEFFKNIGKMNKMIFSPQAYELARYNLMHDPNYAVAARNGLVVDPNKVEDFNRDAMTQPTDAILGSGNRGYFMLKTLRMDLFNRHWDSLPESMKTDGMAKAIADDVNHLTGVVKSGMKHSNLVLFAPRLLASRATWLFVDPFKAAVNVTHPRTMTDAQKWFVKQQIKEKATVLAVGYSLLKLNQAMLQMQNSNQQINMTDPMRSDFLKLKAFGLTASYGGQFVTMSKLPVQLQEARTDKSGLVYPDESMGYVMEKFARSQASPATSLFLDLATKSDFEHRPLPQMPLSGKPTKVPKRLAAEGIKPYTWKEYAMEQISPIPFQEAEREVFRNGFGANEETAKSLGVILVQLMTGARIAEDLESKASPTIEEMQDRVDKTNN